MSATLTSGQHNRIYRRVRRILRQLERDDSGEGSGCLVTAASYPALVTLHHTVSDASWWGSMATAFWLWLVIVCVWGYFSDIGSRRARLSAGATFDRYYPAGPGREAAIDVLRSMARNPNSPHEKSAGRLLEELGEALSAAERQIERQLRDLETGAGPDAAAQAADAPSPGAPRGRDASTRAPIDVVPEPAHIPLEPAGPHDGPARGGRPSRGPTIALEPDDEGAGSAGRS